MGHFCDNCGALISPKKGRDYCPNCKKRIHSEDNMKEIKQNSKQNKNSGLFPFSDVREGQRQFMQDSEEVFSEGRTLLAHAPTGIGKTAAVLTSSIKAKQEDQTIFFLTSKQSQHRIAINTIKNMPSHVRAIDVIAKQSMCPKEESKLPYPVFEKYCSENGQARCNLFNKNMEKVVEKLNERTRHVEKIVDICSSRDVCPHKVALMAGSNADVIVCDYNYIFDNIRESILDLLGIELENCLVIVDEAHNLPDRVRSHLEEEMDVNLLQEAFQLLNGRKSSLASFIKRLAFEVNKLDMQQQRIDKEFLDKIIDRALKGGLGQYEELEDLLKELEMVARQLLEEDPAASSPMRLFSFLINWNHDFNGIFRAYEPMPHTFKVGLLDPSKLTEEVFNRIAGAVLMSGTLHPGDMYADILGIKEPVIRKYQSPFPEENRKILSVNNLTTSYKQRNIQMFQAYANAISDVANNTKGNVAAFFPSYDLMEKIADRLSMVHMKKEIIVEDKKYSKWEKERLVDVLKESENNLLVGVQGGSLSEGVDYKNNILSSVIIGGIPFPPPSLEIEALQEYYTSKFNSKKGYDYTRVYPALNRVLQAAGRCIRSKSDKGMIILMDKRFNYSRYRDKMPDSFNYRVSEDLKKDCRDFFE